ncbi:MAG: phosphoribosyltransferase family protein [Planctomycetota bacterium]
MASPHTPLIGPDALHARVDAMGDELSARFGGGPITTVSLLSGAVFFTADLLRRMPEVRVDMRFLRASSYRGTTRGEIKVRDDQLDPAVITDHRVLIIDDILDSGQTLHAVARRIRDMAPAGVEAAVLLHKRGAQRAEFALDLDALHVGFEIDDEFVIGYGLDYDGRYRNLDHIAVYNGESTR